MTLKQLLRNNRIFLIVWSLIMVTGMVWIALRTKGDGVLFLNRFYTTERNQAFVFITRFGEELGFYLVLILLIIFSKLRHITGFIALMLLVVSITYLLKHYVFPDAERPISYLGPHGLNLVDDLRINRDHSFPSGHTTAGFAFFSYFALLFRNTAIKMIALLIATLVAVSRVYLVQHFVQDVIAGSILGVLLAALTIVLFSESGWIKRIPFFNIGLMK